MPPRTRELADHLDRFALLVSDALEMLRQVFERNFFAHSQRERELPVKLCRFRPEQGGGNRDNRNGDFTRRKPPQSDRSLLGDLVVRRKVLMWQNIERRQELRLGQVAALEEHLEENFECLEQRFGFFVAVDNNKNRLFRRLIEQRQVESFGRADQSRKRKRPNLIARQALQQRLELPDVSRRT